MTIYQGDCLECMQNMPDCSVDMVLTDPPYSSGGMYRSDRAKSTRTKYCDTDWHGSADLPSFTGDNMDQFAMAEFMRMVLAKARQKTKPAGVCCTFVDWRNIVAIINALQAAGWIYRGIIVWDKGNSRGIPGRFRNDCEYIVWGTNGHRATEYVKGVFVGAGCYHVPSVPGKERHHQTEKPVELLSQLIQICPQGGTVLDPFMGSGSTGVACIKEGRDFVGIEFAEQYTAIAKERIFEAMKHSPGGDE